MNIIKAEHANPSLLFWLTIAMLVLGCGSPSPDETSGDSVSMEAGAILITDRTGVRWDVSHAWEVYGMDPEFFNFGLGVGAIPSIDHPTAVTEGDTGFPDSSDQMTVFAVWHNDTARAYATSDLTAHEVINDVIEGETPQHVAVTY